MKFASARGLKRLLSKDALIASVVDRIVIWDGLKLAVDAGSTIYISKYPTIKEDQVIFSIRLQGLFDEDLNDVTAAIQALVGGEVNGNTVTVFTLATDDILDYLELGHELNQQRDAIRQLLAQVAGPLQVEYIEGPQGKPGLAGPPGEPGLPGRDGKDMIATDAELGDLKDVNTAGATVGDFLAYEGGQWRPKPAPKTRGGGGAEPPRLAILDYLQLNTANETNPALAEIRWDQGEHTAVLGLGDNIHNHLGQDIYSWCRNNTGTTIPKGTAVMFAGTLGASGQVLIAPMVADGSYPGYVFLGFTAQTIANNASGNVISYGKLKNINTSAFPEQSILWCNPAVPGGLTAIEPQAPNLKLPVAAVISSKNNGTLMVRWDTGRRLMDLHDVEANGGKQDGDVLGWDATANRWQPKKSVEIQATGDLVFEAISDTQLLVKYTGSDDITRTATLTLAP